MLRFELSEEDVDHLRATLEKEVRELRREISRTEHREFRAMLRTREDSLLRVLDRMTEAAAV